MSACLVLPALLAVLAVAAILIERARDMREERREAARRAALRLSRHPSRRQQPRRTAPALKVPGLNPDGEPLTEDELRQYLGIMHTPVRDPENQNSADESAE